MRPSPRTVTIAVKVAIVFIGGLYWLTACGNISAPNQKPPALALSLTKPDARLATKEKPFENSLGMKFVPVPIKGGPTDGKRVLFSVWETRVRDYEIFARETKREWKKVRFEQGPTHPAANVSWEDAQAFCVWLTERERKAGKLGANQRYRLPTDHEWSCAVGIGNREDAAKSPEEKGGKLDDVFPWGSAFPPPKGAGNYGSILGVDSYEYTSPAGSFSANRHGLYDLGGNVAEWCEDLNKARRSPRALRERTGCRSAAQSNPSSRVVRGGAWYDTDRDDLASSYRGVIAPGDRDHADGFRCVLGMGGSSP